MDGLQDLWRDREQPNISCGVSYYQDKSVSFVWELVLPNDDVITLPSHLRVHVSDHGHDESDVHFNFTTYISTLNYTLPTDDVQRILRCTVQVDDETNGRYDKRVEELLPSNSGTCNDTKSTGFGAGTGRSVHKRRLVWHVTCLTNVIKPCSHRKIIMDSLVNLDKLFYIRMFQINPLE